jgi:hypothetical protein
MADTITATVQQDFSDKTLFLNMQNSRIAVARSVQKKMMNERMKDDMMGMIFSFSEEPLNKKKRTHSTARNNIPDPHFVTVTMQKH